MSAEAFRVTSGRVSAIHLLTPSGFFTLCGRNASGMTRMPADPWSAVGWRAASAGPCQRCSRNA